MKDHVNILGCRGSVPVSGPEYIRYGGNTACVFVRLAGQPVILDGGTGLLEAEPLLRAEDTCVPLLLSHPHADHLLGLPMSPLLTRRGRRVQLYAADREGLDGRAQLSALMAPPLWPIGPEALPCALSFHRITGAFSLGAVTVEVLEGCHPGGVTMFRLSAGGKSVVYCTDCTLEGSMTERAAAFAKDCDLLLCDGQYSPEEWPLYKTYGHNTWEMAARLGVRCGAKKTRIIHHAPCRSDRMLDAAAVDLTAIDPGCAFARGGEEICL